MRTLTLGRWRVGVVLHPRRRFVEVTQLAGAAECDAEFQWYNRWRRAHVLGIYRTRIRISWRTLSGRERAGRIRHDSPRLRLHLRMPL